MFTAKKLSEYLDEYKVTWAKDLPENTPPEDIYIAQDNESLFRLIKEKDIMTEVDLQSYLELYPTKVAEHSKWQASGLSVLSTIDDARSMAKLPTLKGLKGIAEIIMQPEYGVVCNTPSHTCSNHYTWWHTNFFDLNTATINYQD